MKKFVIAVISIILISGVVQAYNDEATKKLEQLMGDIGGRSSQETRTLGLKGFQSAEGLSKIKQLVMEGADPNARILWFSQGMAPGYTLMQKLIDAAFRMKNDDINNNLLEDVIRTALEHGAKTGLDQRYRNAEVFLGGILGGHVLGFDLNLRIIQLLFDHATPEEKAYIATALEDILKNWKTGEQSENVKEVQFKRVQLERVQTVKRMLEKSMQK